MTNPTPSQVNPATLFKSPVKAIWNVQGENIPTLWWPAKDHLPLSKNSQNEPRHTVLFMIPACHLGHSGGSHITDPSRMYSLDEQVASKIAIVDRLREMYPVGTRFILAGHSMGSWLALQVLKARPNHGIERVFELFPTIHRIADTPNGRKLKVIFSAPPVLRSIVGLVAGQEKDMAEITSQKLLHSSVVKNCLFLANQEMETIKVMDRELIEEHASKFVFYYGKTDEWSPIENYYEMRDEFPKIKSFLCEQGMVHAFVLGHGEAMGLLVGGWINEM
ncbi:hypothetical protein BGZ80_003197 [Entomortierella chlamydospora]|uniref:Uncharacterized protein n=1 Tax=Entomortierella chlamydospora TaxID=101097 RepID=A0A9P6SWT9_9FUNG|nr:hypothetical protein BGZ80_003197 [Entomortierella chlamydospora]